MAKKKNKALSAAEITEQINQIKAQRSDLQQQLEALATAQATAILAGEDTSEISKTRAQTVAEIEALTTVLASLADAHERALAQDAVDALEAATQAFQAQHDAVQAHKPHWREVQAQHATLEKEREKARAAWTSAYEHLRNELGHVDLAEQIARKLSL